MGDRILVLECNRTFSRPVESTRCADPNVRNEPYVWSSRAERLRNDVRNPETVPRCFRTFVHSGATHICSAHFCFFHMFVRDGANMCTDAFCNRVFGGAAGDYEPLDIDISCSLSESWPDRASPTAVSRESRRPHGVYMHAVFITRGVHGDL